MSSLTNVAAPLEGLLFDDLEEVFLVFAENLAVAVLFGGVQLLKFVAICIDLKKISESTLALLQASVRNISYCPANCVERRSLLLRYMVQLLNL